MRGRKTCVVFVQSKMKGLIEWLHIVFQSSKRKWCLETKNKVVVMQSRPRMEETDY